MPAIPELVVSEYKLTREQIDSILKIEIRKQLNIPHERILTFDYVLQERSSDPMDHFPGIKEVTGLRIMVK